MFLRIIKIIGPKNRPSNPITLKPVYIAIRVKIGCIPILLLTSFGSSICLNTNDKTYKPTNSKESEILPSIKENIAQGIITVPEPTIGRASTKAIPKAQRRGYCIFKPVNFPIYNPIKIIKNDIAISITSAFK